MSALGGFAVGLVVGVVFGAVLMACCAVSGQSSSRERLIRELDREKRRQL